MLRETRKELDGEKQKVLLRRMVEEMSRGDPGVYYLSTTEIAARIEQRIVDGAGLLAEERGLLRRLRRRDIELLLSLH